MKKRIIVVMCLIFALAFTACGNSDNVAQGSTDGNSVSGDATDEGKSDVGKMHREYVKTYTVYAEQGAVVTWFDSKTGKFSYKAKCEACGKTESGTHSGLRCGDNTTYSSGYNCQNPQCSERGKSQPVKIGCKVTGEWVEVSD